MALFLFALLAGFVTIAGPCILPLLPIILGTSTVRAHAARPLLIVLGFIVSFSLFAILFSLFGSVLGVSPDMFRNIAAVIIGLFGVMMLFPRIQESIFAKLQPLLQRVTPQASLADNGLVGGFVLGASLGLVWSPCAGPVLGSILTLVASKQDSLQAGVLLGAYALGAGIPMLLIAYGGQAAVTRVRSLAKYTIIIQRIFGAIIIAVAIALATGADRTVQSCLVSNAPWLFPSLTLEIPTTTSTATTAASQIPEFVGITRWWNTANNAPLTADQLKGKVVLVDFWTYSCINCIRTYPFLRSMQEKYADQGLVIVGVHTPEFAFEKDSQNVEREITKNGLLYPIALDPDYATWNAYANHYWPAKYLFDRNGQLQYTHFGEGEYEETERKIRELLSQNATVTLPATGDELSTPDFSKIKTAETYFGLARAENFSDRLGPENRDASFHAIPAPPANHWTIDGTWRFTQEYTQAQSSNALFRFNVQANVFHLVLASADGTNKTIEVYVDGKKTKSLTINTSTLYTIAEFPDGLRHTVELRMMDPGVQFYAATFS